MDRGDAHQACQTGSTACVCVCVCVGGGSQFAIKIWS